MSRISDNFLDDVRARLSVSDVVGRSVRLQKRGREFVGLSPFNKEKTPSFTVNDQKGFYHCFSSGKHGDIFRFLMETEGLTFTESVERLAGEAGLALPQPTPEARARTARQLDLYQVMEAACQWFEAQLAEPAGQMARKYLYDRGLEAHTQKMFRLGYAPDASDRLQTTLRAQGISQTLLEAAGLVRKSEVNCFDYFRGRIMFPITDQRGRVIAFGARTLGDKLPKYLNSPETDLFHKGSVLYGMATARKSAFDASCVVVCEGYMDVIALAQSGLLYAVAPLGTAMTHQQIESLWRLAPDPVICLDGDKAGRAAAKRVASRVLEILKPGYSLRFTFLPDGEDPDTFVRRQGAEAFKSLVDRASPLAEVLVADTVSDVTSETTPEQRAALEKHLVSMALTIQDQTVRGYYMRHFKDALWEKLRRFPRVNPHKKRHMHRSDYTLDRPLSPGVVHSETGSRHREMALLSLMIRHPQIIGDVSDPLTHFSFTHPDLDRLCGCILNGVLQNDYLDSDALKAYLHEAGHGAVLSALDGDSAIHAVRADQVAQTGQKLESKMDRYGKDEMQASGDMTQIIQVWHDIYNLARVSALESELHHAECAFAETPNEDAWRRLESLRKARDTVLK